MLFFDKLNNMNNISRFDFVKRQISDLPPEKPLLKSSSNIITELEPQQPESKKEKWNAYMRKYNAKKKQEREERLSKVALRAGNIEKLYDVNDINELIINFIDILILICNNNHDKLNIDELRQSLYHNIDDIYKYSVILQDAVKSII